MEIYEYLRELLPIPSLSWKEDGISAYVISRMSEFGYVFRDDSIGNLLFYRSLRGPKVMLATHMDTVALANEPHVLENDEYFYTDGRTALGADDKASIAALLKAAESSPDALFLFTRAEETGCQGSAKLTPDFFRDFDIKAVFVLDASGEVGTAITAAPGKDVIDITITGKTAHAGFAPESGINAIQTAAVAISRTATGRIDEETTCNLGTLMAPGSINVVPDKATYSYEVRSRSDEKRIKKTEEIIYNAEHAAIESGAKCEVSRKTLYLPYSVTADDASLKIAEKAIEAIGRKMDVKSTSGGSDTNNLRTIGLDAITLSVGYENPHSVNERMPKKELEALAKLASSLLSL